VYERHTGANLALCLAAVLDRYGINDKIGVLVTDNASNNTTLAKELEYLLPHFIHTDYSLYLGHLINRIVLAMTKRFGVSLTVQEDLGVDSDLFEEWRKLRPVGKLRNIMSYANASILRREEIAKLAAIVRDVVVVNDDIFMHALMLIANGGGK
jgi:hypothetical protein